MTSLSAPLTTISRPALAGRWARLRRLLAAGERDASLRAGAERPAVPMLMSISLGGVAHLRR